MSTSDQNPNDGKSVFRKLLFILPLLLPFWPGGFLHDREQGTASLGSRNRPGHPGNRCKSTLSTSRRKLDPDPQHVSGRPRAVKPKKRKRGGIIPEKVCEHFGFSIILEFCGHFSLLKNRQIPLHPPFQRGKKRNLLWKAFRKALLPLKKGGREGFMSPFQKTKLIRILKNGGTGLGSGPYGDPLFQKSESVSEFSFLDCFFYLSAGATMPACTDQRIGPHL